MRGVLNKEEKEEPISNNYFTLFTENEKMVSGDLAATKVKNNSFSILSNSKIWSFKFDHIISTKEGSEEESQPNEDLEKEAEGEGNKEKEPSQTEKYLDCEVDRF